MSTALLELPTEPAVGAGLRVSDGLRAALAATAPDGGGLSVGDLRQQLNAGRREIRCWFEAGGDAAVVHRELSRQMDALIQGVLDHAERHFYRRANPTTGERLAVVATGGYGRGELAPCSDIDLLFLHAYKPTPFVEQIAEFLLYRLWDLGLKVGQATRSTSETLKLAKSDLTVRTSLLEMRPVWGDAAIFGSLQADYERQFTGERAVDFIEAKLAERDQRHQKAGDSRYLQEPNIKEGKGGLRDLHTLIWLGRALYGIQQPADLVAHGLLSAASLRLLERSLRFLWTVRCHLHYQAGRAEERLTFDLQPTVAAAMGYRDRPGCRGVERFMKRSHLVFKDVGGLTRIVCAAIEEQHRRRSRFALPLGALARRRIGDFVVQGGRLSAGSPDLFQRQPAAMLELFRLAQERGLDLHPEALSAVQANLHRVGAAMRADPGANHTFLAMLTAKGGAAPTLTRLNEAGLLGRFVPEFGRIVAQAQHNLYHVYTVDEHTIRAIEVLDRIEAGQLAQELPLATDLMGQLVGRPELYLAMLFHDVGKGRGGDHSQVGRGLAEKACARLGVARDVTETVAWLIEHHLAMSRFAFKRDLEDPATIQDFVALVQSPHRLRLLLLLTVADITAVGPKVWNGWKGQLLRELYHEAAAAMATGDTRGRRKERVDAAQAAMRDGLANHLAPPWPEPAIAQYLARLDPRYWLSFPLDEQLRHAELVRNADASRSLLTLDFRVDRFRARTEIVVYAPDHAGLFMKIAGALALSGASIVDAHIFTTSDGMALDVLGFQDADGHAAVEDRTRHARIALKIEQALSGEIWLERALAGRRSLPKRADVFRVEPRVLVDNAASGSHSVLEVNGRDRPGLLFDVARTLKDLGLVIHSAHVATYGERVVDVFYVKDVFGMKVTQPTKLARVEKALLQVLPEPGPQPLAAE